MERNYEEKKGALEVRLSIVLRSAFAAMVLMSCSLGLRGVTTISTSNTIGSPAGQALYYSSTDPIAAVPALFDGDSFDGWVYFNSGLAIPQAARITLNTVGILGGALDLGNENSTLVLGQDLQCRADLSITGTAGGRITGNGNILKLGGDLTVNYPLMTTALTIDGQGHRVKLTCVNAFSPTDALTLRNMDLILTTNSLFSGGGTTYNFENVNIYLQDNISIAGSANVAGRVAIYGSGYAFSSNHAFAIADNSTFYIGPGVSLAFQTACTMTLTGPGSTLALDGCTLDIATYSNADLTLTKGMITFANQVCLLATDRTITLGDGTSVGNIVAKVLSDACVIVDGTLYHNPS